MRSFWEAWDLVERHEVKFRGMRSWWEAWGHDERHEGILRGLRSFREVWGHIGRYNVIWRGLRSYCEALRLLRGLRSYWEAWGHIEMPEVIYIKEAWGHSEFNSIQFRYLKKSAHSCMQDYDSNDYRIFFRFGRPAGEKRVYVDLAKKNRPVQQI
jgi:hypothetical protein